MRGSPGVIVLACARPPEELHRCVSLGRWVGRGVRLARNEGTMLPDNFPQIAVPAFSDLWMNELVHDVQHADEAISPRVRPKSGVLERVDAPRVLPQPFPPGGMRIGCHC